MTKYDGIPELLSRFMETDGAAERWVTVREVRDRFGLSRSRSSTISGFLRRIEFTSYRHFPYVVRKVELLERESPSAPLRYRYLLAKRGSGRGDAGACREHAPAGYAGIEGPPSERRTGKA